MTVSSPRFQTSKTARCLDRKRSVCMCFHRFSVVYSAAAVFLTVALGPQLLEAELAGSAVEQLSAVHALLSAPPVLLRLELHPLLQHLQRRLLRPAGLPGRQHRVHRRVDFTRSSAGRDEVSTLKC